MVLRKPSLVIKTFRVECSMMPEAMMVASHPYAHAMLLSSNLIIV
jgi:hypothetical protein